ncbi:MAG: HEAT repeat domain-containing protein [Nannocystaceae bacterium]
MSNTDKFLPYRGDLQAITASGGALHLVTTHPEGQATAIYSVELDKLELATDALPCGASAIVADGAALFVAGADGHVYKAGGRGATKALGAALTPAPSGLALVSHDRLAVIAGAELVIVARKDGKELQRLALAEPATAIASDPSGEWIVVGGERGGLAVFEGEGRKDFIASDAKKVHEGPVKALLFEPEELRVLSGGVDSKIFLTHVRGALDPEDRSGKQGHADAVTCMVHGPGDKTYSGGRDGVLKVWTRGQGRASTVKDGVVKSVALVMCEYRGRPHIAVAGDDQTVRLFIVDAAGKPGDRIVTLRGAEAWAQNELGRKEPRAREAALKTIAGWNDAVAIELLGKTAQGDGDHQLKVLATELLGASGNGRAGKHLGGLLKAGEEAVRLRALAGLRALEGMSALGPLRLALGAQKRDIGVVAIQALAGLAARDDLAFDLLVEALGFQPSEVRIAALLALESLSDADSPQADLLALRSKQADVRRLAILRFYQRRMVDRPEVGAALRRHAADADAGVRQVAYLVSLLQVPRLAGALRYRDRQLHRQLHDIESAPAPSFELAAGGAEDEASTAARASLLAALEGRGGGDDEAAEAAAPSGKSGKGGLPKPAKVDASKLTEADMRPLLEAMASRALDTCLAGATGLALLGDPRALGTLLQLSRERDTGVRVEVCKALQALGDPRGAARLRLLMRDSEASVRDAAFSALIKLEDKAPLPIAEAGLLAEHEDIRRRGLDLLVRQLRDARKGGAAASIDAAAATSLLERALGDAAKSVRSEAFKAALNLEIDGGGAGSLRFALRSLQADIRREVLSEVLGQIEQPWAWELLLQLFSDPDPGVRSEAFEFAMKRTRGIGLEPLQAALAGPYADLRTEATKILSKRKAPGISELLAKAARDEDEGVRQLAVEALLVNDADDALVEAMFSPHADVVVKAAAARAIHGDPRALAALVRVVREAEPEIPALQAKWKGRLIAALSGLAELGDPSARSVIVPLLQHKDAAIRSAAADALAWSIRPGEAEGLAALQAALQHSDAAVRTRAALGLAYVGDLAGASILFAQKNQGLETLHAALALGARAHDVFMAFLDQGSDAIRGRALLLLLLQEFAEGDGVPDRCLAALSSAHPRVR